MTSGPGIRELREMFRIPQSEAARLTGIDPVMFDLIEKGAAATPKEIRAIRDVLLEHAKTRDREKQTRPRNDPYRRGRR